MDLNKKNIQKILGIATFIILLHWGFQNFDVVFSLFRKVLSLLTPFLLGICIAFIINVPMRFIEKKLFTDRWAAHPKKPPKKWEVRFKRPICIVLTILMFLGIIFVVMFLIIPEIGVTVGVIADNFPAFWAGIQTKINNLAKEYPELGQQIASLQIDWKEIGQTIFSWLQSGAGFVLSNTFNIAVSVVNGFFNFFVGIFFAIYLLSQKEKLGRQGRQLLYAYLPERKVDQGLGILKLSDKAFSKFFSGQCIEVLLLGLMFFVTMTLFRIPYALMVSVLIALLAMIPIFGAFIGMVVGAFLICVSDPVKAFWFIILFLVLQQIEGNLVYPRVVGSSVGLPSIWVLVAVSVGGSMMGVVGMIIFIPVCSILYTLIKEASKNRLRLRNIPASKLK